jgi:hypothetical protein
VTPLPATPQPQLLQPTASERWSQVPRRWRLAMILAGAVLIAYFASSLVSGLYSPPSSSAVGPSSSTDTASVGTAAMAQLLSERQHPVQQLTVPLHAATIPTNGTLFVLDPAGSILPDAAELQGHLDAGGRLVLGGPTASGLLQRILGHGPVPVWRSSPSGNASPVEHLPEDAGVSTVFGDGPGSWGGNETSFSVLLQGPGGALALETAVGRGTLVVLASTSPLQNGFLAQADDAAFALDLAGPAGVPVIFDEYDHGLGRSGTGLDGLPSHWKAGLVVALLAVLTWMWSVGRRFGPPQRADRELIPARVAHVDAMAALLASGPVDRLAAGAVSLQSEGRETLRRTLRAGPLATDEELIQLAATGSPPSVTPELAAALLRTPQSESDVIAEGRAFVALAHRERPR